MDLTQIWSERTLGGTDDQEEVLVEDASTSSDEEEDVVTLKEHYAVMSRYKSASAAGSSKRVAEDSNAVVSPVVKKLRNTVRKRPVKKVMISPDALPMVSSQKLIVETCYSR